MKCVNCPYWWEENGEMFENCHYYAWDDGYTPCKMDEPQDYEEYNEYEG